MKTTWIIILITLIVILGFITGIYFYRINKIENVPKEETIVTSKIDDECTAISELASLRHAGFGINWSK